MARIGERFPTIDEFYDQDDRRRWSPEVDFGVMWREEPRGFPHFRVSWVEETGEFYAVPLRAGQEGPVELLGWADGRIAADRALAGWAEEDDNLLPWARARLRESRPPARRATADAVEIDGDEDGWHLRVETDGGDRYDFRIQGAAYDLAGSRGFQALAEWRAEGEDVRLSRPPREIDEVGYALDDPKHPDYRERMADLDDDGPVLGRCPHGVDLDAAVCPEGCRV